MNNKAKLVALISIILLIFIIYHLSYYNTNNHEDYLYGFWVAEADEFCDEAEIDSILLFIGERKNNARECYLVIMPDISNQSFTIKYKPSSAGFGISNYCVSAEVEFEDEQLWDDKIKIETNLLEGTIKIYSEDTIYLKAQKQHDITNISKYLDSE